MYGTAVFRAINNEQRNSKKHSSDNTEKARTDHVRMDIHVRKRLVVAATATRAVTEDLQPPTVGLQPEDE